jgi:hypothetical protein
MREIIEEGLDQPFAGHGSLEVPQLPSSGPPIPVGLARVFRLLRNLDKPDRSRTSTDDEPPTTTRT